VELKQLEIKGFKSFADKTVLHFDRRITGVVGPNGCGKSNIVDAIRWVLGEQSSRTLRSDKMENVLFNGTKARKPSGLAEVSLTFENTKGILPTEYHTVTVTRTLYRTGESEYRLNNVACRLKDIQNLLVDTGMGSNSYAIIALGMVDDLLNDRENSRRRLFEQAAGISKYKMRKQETHTRLEATEQHLERVADLLHEITTNLKMLERQAKRTQKFVELKELYKVCSVELAVFQLSGHKQDYKRIEQQLAAEERQLVAQETLLRSLEAQLSADKATMLEKEQALSEQQQAIHTLTAQIRTKENDKKLAQQRVAFIQQNQTNLFSQMEHAQLSLAQSELHAVRYEQELASELTIGQLLEQELKQAEQHLQAARQQHATLKGDLDAQIQKQQHLSKQVFELEKQKAVMANRQDNALADIQRINADLERRRAEVAVVATELDAVQRQYTAKETGIQELEAAEVRRKLELEQIERAMDALRTEIAALARTLDAKNNEYKLTKSLVDNLEGFPEAVKFLSKQWNVKAPLLSDVIYCEAEYRIAIENYLDTYLNHYLVSDTDTALSAIQLLRKSNKGKANFFILDAFQTYTQPNLEVRDNWIPALRVVRTDEAYQPLCNYLLGNVWLGAYEPTQEAPDVPPHITCLYTSGALHQSKYVWSGGSVGLFEGKRIGRRKSLEVLQTAIQETETLLKQRQQQLQALQQQHQTLHRNNNQPAIQREREQANTLHRQLVSLQTRRESFETFLHDANQRKQTLQQQITQTTQQQTLTSQQLDELNADEQTLRLQIAEHDASYRTIADQLNNVATHFNQKNIENIRHQNKLSSIQRELAFHQKQTTELQQKIAVDTQQQQKAQQELQTAQTDISTLDQTLHQLYSQRALSDKDLVAAEQSYYQLRNTLSTLEDELRRQNRTIQQTQQLINTLKDQFNSLKITLTSIAERLRVSFNIPINDILNREPNTQQYSLPELEQQTERTKKQLDNFGEVNPLAIEAFNEMNERFEFTQAQLNDIQTAKEQLLHTIREIDTTATQQFLNAFETVRTHFQRVFRSLFTDDDSCDLLLDAPQAPLESAIKIIARPKGKRPQTINQLSGGEKTLTATALLFALYLLKPAPFCIFDEVDAPLDDANIAKFNNIVRTFSTDSQFIIVTHNKQTMAAVDLIYGITMPEQGISRVVPVNFQHLPE
jgi:chromosome segregation protein